jgi:hypothetical protein
LDVLERFWFLVSGVVRSKWPLDTLCIFLEYNYSVVYGLKIVDLESDRCWLLLLGIIISTRQATDRGASQANKGEVGIEEQFGGVQGG